MTGSVPSLVSPFVGIVDIHHHDGAYDLDELQRGGVVAMVHKATQGEKLKSNVRGSGWKDPAFKEAMRRVKAAGMLRGAYHFCTGTADGRDQAEHFLSTVGDDIDDMLLMMDWESNPDDIAGDMTRDNLALMAETIKERTGRWPFMYSFTHYFKKNYKTEHPVLGRCPLWIAQYGEKPRWLPPGFAHYELWQYTSGKAGPRDQRTYPRTTPGFKRDRQDRNAYFGGGAEELAFDWLRWGRW